MGLETKLLCGQCLFAIFENYVGLLHFHLQGILEVEEPQQVPYANYR